MVAAVPNVPHTRRDVPGRLAQLVLEHLLDKQGVTGSSPVPPMYPVKNPQYPKGVPVTWQKKLAPPVVAVPITTSFAVETACRSSLIGSAVRASNRGCSAPSPPVPLPRDRFFVSSPFRRRRLKSRNYKPTSKKGSTVATAIEPVVPVIPADVLHVGHLHILDEDSEWNPFRFHGVTHDTADAGFPGKGCLPLDIQVVQSDGSVELPLWENLDPETEEMLYQHYLAEVKAEAESIPRRRSKVETPADFFRDFDQWIREDPWGRRYARAIRRSETRPLRCSMKRKVARLERERSRFDALSESDQQQFWNCWGRVTTELNQIKTRGGSHPSWVRVLCKRLMALAKPTHHAVHSPRSTGSSKQHSHGKKQSRKNKKHTSAKTRLHKGTAVFS